MIPSDRGHKMKVAGQIRKAQRSCEKKHQTGVIKEREHNRVTVTLLFGMMKSSDQMLSKTKLCREIKCYIHSYLCFLLDSLLVNCLPATVFLSRSSDLRALFHFVFSLSCPKDLQKMVDKILRRALLSKIRIATYLPSPRHFFL